MRKDLINTISDIREEAKTKEQRDATDMEIADQIMMHNYNFNRMTPAETERLSILAEECAEVIQAVGKILRHGYNSHCPGDAEEIDNRSQLEKRDR